MSTPTKAKRHSPYPRNLSVFINCPYDEAYQTIFDGIVFAIICCGFIPRCAIEKEQVSEPRLTRILAGIKESKYSFHDLCRCNGEGNQNLARFNMPLELGFAMKERFDNEASPEKHDWYVIVPPNHTHAKFISDLAGYDPPQVEQKVDKVIRKIVGWLGTSEDAVEGGPQPSKIIEAFYSFHDVCEELREEYGGYAPWKMIVKEALYKAEKIK